MMGDLIRREDVAEALYQAIRTTLPGTFTDSMSLAISMANNLPSAEPEERTAKVIKHKYWLGVRLNVVGEQIIGYEWLCDNCKKKVIDGDDYCSHCGSKLIWGDENDF